jgi:hypothetical protein
LRRSGGGIKGKGVPGSGCRVPGDTPPSPLQRGTEVARVTEAGGSETLAVAEGARCRGCGCQDHEILERGKRGEVEFERRRCRHCGKEFVVDGGEASRLEIRRNECPLCRDRGIRVVSVKHVGEHVVRYWQCPNELCAHHSRLVKTVSDH